MNFNLQLYVKEKQLECAAISGKLEVERDEHLTTLAETISVSKSLIRYRVQLCRSVVCLARLPRNLGCLLTLIHSQWRRNDTPFEIQAPLGRKIICLPTDDVLSFLLPFSGRVSLYGARLPSQSLISFFSSPFYLSASSIYSSFHPSLLLSPLFLSSRFSLHLSVVFFVCTLVSTRSCLQFKHCVRKPLADLLLIASQQDVTNTQHASTKRAKKGQTTAKHSRRIHGATTPAATAEVTHSFFFVSRKHDCFVIAGLETCGIAMRGMKTHS